MYVKAAMCFVHPCALNGLRENRMRMAAENVFFFHFPMGTFEVMCSVEIVKEPNKFAFFIRFIAKRVKAN